MICVIELQFLSRVIATGDYSIIENNAITEDYFKRDKNEESFVDEFNFIKEHYDKYGNVPDRETFLSRFPVYKDGGLPDVSESSKYLVDALREEYTFRKYAPILKKAADIALEDANAGVEYMLQAIKDVQVNYNIGGTNIIADADVRLEHYKDRIDNQENWYFSSGFPEIDQVIHGIKRISELIVVYARTNQGKSWVLEKMIAHIWRLGFNVGYISPEMDEDSIGYRFDTLYKGFSNSDLTWGNTGINIEEYEKYIEDLRQTQTKFIVATPRDFGNRITISKLRNFVKQNNLEALAVDGITYISDERGRRNDNKTTSLTNISEDLMSLSGELGIPIFVVVQANRNGVIDSDTDGTPGLESIRDSDGIAHNASKVFSVRQKDGGMSLCVAKNREGKVGMTFKYLWNINIGEWIYTPDDNNVTEEERVERRERKKESGKDVF